MPRMKRLRSGMARRAITARRSIRRKSPTFWGTFSPPSLMKILVNQRAVVSLSQLSPSRDSRTA